MKKIIVFLIIISIILSSIIYLKFNYIKIPNAGYVKLLKGDASVSSHEVDNTVLYKREFVLNGISENKIITYIEKEQHKSKLPQVIDLPDKNILKKINR